MVRREAFPDPGEFVLCSVKKVEDFGAFVELDEFPGREGFIHIREIASGWVKYVRDHIREGQKTVCKVLEVDPKRGHVDLSLKRVNDHQRREKISEWKNEQKAENLMRILGDELDREPEAMYEEFAFDLVDVFGSLYAAFEAAAMDDETLKEEGFEGAWVEPFIQIARDNVSLPHVTVTNYLSVQCRSPDGVEAVKEALGKGEETEYEDVTVEIQYVGAPVYRLRVTAPDYKAAEEEISEAADRVLRAIETLGGEGEVSRELPA